MVRFITKYFFKILIFGYIYFDKASAAANLYMKELNQLSKADEIGEKWLALSKTAGPVRQCLRMRVSERFIC